MTLQQAREDLAAGTMPQDEFDAFVTTYRRQRKVKLGLGGGVLLLGVLLLSLAFCGRGNGKKTTPPPPVADASAATSALESVKNTIMSAIAGLTSRVEALENVKPSPVPKTGASQRAVGQLAGKIEVLSDQMGDQARRLDAIEATATTASRPIVQSLPPIEPEPEEEELTDEQLAEQYKQAVRRDKLPDNQ